MFVYAEVWEGYNNSHMVTVVLQNLCQSPVQDRREKRISNIQILAWFIPSLSVCFVDV